MRRTDADVGKSIKLSTAFIMTGGRLNKRRRSLGFALRIGVRVPAYEGDESFASDHYEGGVLFGDKLNIEVTPAAAGSEARVRYGWDRTMPNRVRSILELSGGETEHAKIGEIQFGSRAKVRPGIKGKLRFTIEPWNG